VPTSSPIGAGLPPLGDDIRRVGIVFSGGPAPAANAAISAAAISFIEDGREVIGFYHGYSNLHRYDPVAFPLLADEHYRALTSRDVRGVRNTRGILLGTARTNPGRGIRGPQDLDDPERTAGIATVYNALVALGIDALVSIGGDDTLKTANFLHAWQLRLSDGAPRVRVVHLPKTIDNDYHGIDFSFGFFTAVDVMAKEVENLQADAAATSSWFLVETMGRKAGWLSYGVAIAGEADLVIGVEDLDHTLTTSDPNGSLPGGRSLDLDLLCERIADTLVATERRGKHHGVIVLAEGLAEALPARFLAGSTRDEHGHVTLGEVDLARLVAGRAADRYQERSGSRKKIKPLQLGYESRCAPPHAFDVMLGSQLGIGAYRALVEEGLDGHMVSVSGQLDLHYVPFADLVDPTTLETSVRFIDRNSDFWRLARFLEERTDRHAEWGPGRRREEQ
jgi:ATP-dependent phosphofructokinase / diphosphate-dependent phosphofructokinase